MGKAGNHGAVDNVVTDAHRGATDDRRIDGDVESDVATGEPGQRARHALTLIGVQFDGDTHVRNHSLALGGGEGAECGDGGVHTATAQIGGDVREHGSRDRCSSCGELIAPPDRMTSALARSTWRCPPRRYSTPTARPFSITTRVTNAPVTTRQFGRFIAGRRKARAAELRRAPLIVIW